MSNLPQTISAPKITYDQIKKYANTFLKQYQPEGTLPIPIEEIIEVKLKIHLIPIPYLKKTVGKEAFISGDLSEIWVDEKAYSTNSNRLHFTLAHEIGHKILHPSIYRERPIDGYANWTKFMGNINEKNEFYWFERQANIFAGLVLVPPESLEKHIKPYKKVLEEVIGNHPEMSRESLIKNSIPYITKQLSDIFQVSEQVIEIRIEKDKLSNKL